MKSAKARQPNPAPVKRALEEVYRLIHEEAVSVAVTTLGFKPGKGMFRAIKRESAAFDLIFFTHPPADAAYARGRSVGIVEHLLLSRLDGTLDNAPEFLLELFDDLRSLLPIARRYKLAA